MEESARAVTGHTCGDGAGFSPNTSSTAPLDRLSTRLGSPSYSHTAGASGRQMTSLYSRPSLGDPTARRQMSPADRRIAGARFGRHFPAERRALAPGLPDVLEALAGHGHGSGQFHSFAGRGHPPLTQRRGRTDDPQFVIEIKRELTADLDFVHATAGGLGCIAVNLLPGTNTATFHLRRNDSI